MYSAVCYYCFLFIKPYAHFLSATGLVSAAVLLGVTVTAFPTWQSVRNINDGFHWKDGFHTVQPFYWMTLVLEIIFFIIYVIDFRKRKKFKEKP